MQDEEQAGLEAAVIGRLAERSAADAAGRLATVRLVGGSQPFRVEFMSQRELEGSSPLTVQVEAEADVVIRIRPDAYRVFSTPLMGMAASDAPSQTLVTFLAVPSSGLEIDLSRLAASRLPFPRAGD